MNEKPLLSVQNLSVIINKNGNQFTAVNDISFDLFPGEILGIVGESGCGKSLTALSIAGLLPAVAEAKGSVLLASGSIASGGNDEALCPVRGKEISYIFQEPVSSLNPLMKIGRQITETPEIHGRNDRTENRQKALELLRKMGLENPERVMESYPFQLSGGMCQRVMIAIAMICGPRILVADEPTTALDAKTEDQILNLLAEINRELNTAILFISHDLNIIRRICGRVMVMYAGALAEYGTTGEVFSNPGHEYTRSLLGALPERHKRGERLSVIPGKVPSIEENIYGQKKAGCPFAPRCVKAVTRCVNETMPRIKISETHFAHCINGGEPE